MQIPLHKINENKLFIKWRDIKIEPNNEEKAHRHDYYQFMFLEEVSGTHIIDFESYQATDNSLHFVGKSRVHKVDYASNVIGGVLLFPESIFNNSESDMKLLSSFSFFKNGAHPLLDLELSDFNSVKDLVNKIKDSLQKDSLEMSKYLLFALLIQVRELYNKTVKSNKSKKEPRELMRYQELLKEHGTSWKTLNSFTTSIGITTLRLNNFCKKHYGKTALQLLHDRKLLAAKRMLVYSEKQVKEIAFDCGFNDVAYFNRFFKKHTNCTPLIFRRNH
jgi:AraC-like DNA-binding protein